MGTREMSCSEYGIILAPTFFSPFPFPFCMTMPVICFLVCYFTVQAFIILFCHLIPFLLSVCRMYVLVRFALITSFLPQPSEMMLRRRWEMMKDTIVAGLREGQRKKKKRKRGLEGIVIARNKKKKKTRRAQDTSVRVKSRVTTTRLFSHSDHSKANKNGGEGEIEKE
ncbi:MAG: hypothetical protein J3R72DRAFT_258948 [Linnemannia gamsii]|nr:MAG: hypothetical protein J3R72DRAFT_258948 [Linnemannia gamsii]